MIGNWAKEQMMSQKTIKMIVAGAGDRGVAHARSAARLSEGNVEIVGVAEPREHHRNQMVEEFGIPPQNAFTDWRDMAEREIFADAVVIATQDAMHTEPAEAFAAKGYHILLEKPMAPTPEECRRITTAVTENDCIFAVGHVLRYTPYTQKLKEIVDSGALGEIVTMDRVEALGYWHQAHSYVRGNWRNEAESSFILMAKACHDIDWMHYIMGARCTAVSSFGSLQHFRPECQPEGAADRCMECSVESTCPYSAKRIYFSRLRKGETDWPLNVVVPNPTEERLTEALKTGPYGRCVYTCDNDVVDHQVVNMQFDTGATASFTLTGCSTAGHRQTRIFGTRGELIGNGSIIKVFDFLTETWTEHDTNAADSSILGGHGGGDGGLMLAFIDAIQNNDPTRILSGPQETLDSHLMVFAAEQARREGRVVALDSDTH
jgi:predicted dehydrogenase